MRFGHCAVLIFGDRDTVGGFLSMTNTQFYIRCRDPKKHAYKEQVMRCTNLLIFKISSIIAVSICEYNLEGSIYRTLHSCLAKLPINYNT